MLNPFPQLLVFGFFAPTLVRAAAACVFLYLAYWHFKNKKECAQELTILSHEVATWAVGLYILIELAAGVGLFVGAWTQIAALVGFVICLKILIIKRNLHALAPFSRVVYVLLAVMCLSLMTSGAGALAFDVPL